MVKSHLSFYFRPRRHFKPTWPTRLGALFIVMILFIGMMAIVFSNNLFYLVVATLLGFISVSGLLAEYTLAGLSVRIRMASELFAGSPVPVAVELSNGKRGFPSFWLAGRLQDDGPFGPDRFRVRHLPAAASMNVLHTIAFARRGWHQVDGLWISTRFPFSLAEKASFLSCPHRVLVYPAPISPPAMESALSGSDGPLQRSVRGAGTSAASLRDYVPGDPYRMIHWKRSARVNVLKVRELEQEAERAVTVVLTSLCADSIEEGVSLTTGLLLAMEAEEVQTPLITHEK
ncbi:MAG: DUF58 domain-containing protein, partial [Candidatus Riflebacteria bacterium]|nr:DUF58 domain-containing protein [Candidatus Riflebacteria bacterium]